MKRTTNIGNNHVLILPQRPLRPPVQILGLRADARTVANLFDFFFIELLVFLSSFLACQLF